jgi:hypothetical protein
MFEGREKGRENSLSIVLCKAMNEILEKVRVKLFGVKRDNVCTYL